ncbi:Orotate phosphoribosyltransferase [Hondaea fermentalgiana]|uniref:Orotidine 5'-phosphate decarboxylase n=1 Tax=Hondaea fermentalgiana TaxID=2315210 RepID=A0A2R5GD95_9STRA|nr:Orotate phosphoribosyltransferase [Hondaea fermentalgiana]|eukprot:GBG26141.1 Orotate phosphoribosyltransferase [Hondaea fermentalgiana]
MPSFFATLEARVKAANSLVCVGLDPHAEDVAKVKKDKGIESDAEAAFEFSKALIEATQHVAAAYKPNAAFFEAFGAEGVEALQRVVAAVPAEIPVVLDVKRGDISSTAKAYATAAYDAYKAHCVTLSPYMGEDSIAPFVGEDETRGAFVLCKTSNPSSEDLETVALTEGGLLYERVAKLCEKWNAKDNVGLVVGATDVEALAKSRAAAPSLWILAPGVGFQGGDLEAAAKAGLRADGMGLLVPVSRGIARAEDPKAAAEKFRDLLNGVRKAAEDAEPAAKRAKTEGAEEALEPFQKQFFELALRCEVLKFGKFTLKSGRESPYFFNAGLFNSGSALDGLGEFYAEAIMRSKVEFDVLFGPAYKGIPLASVIATALYRKYGKDTPVAYNRKEKKDHGEGGLLVGAPVRGKRVLVVDDVITAGTAVRECIEMLSVEDASIIGVVIALDRQERAKEGSLSAIQAVKKEFGFDVHSIVCLDDLLAFLRSSGTTFDDSVLTAVEAYRKEYGVDK